MKMKNLSLIIERGDDGQAWGRVKYQGDLLVETAKTEALLISKMKQLLKEDYELMPDDISFSTTYDISSLFEHKSFLNITAIANEAGINPTLMRQYVSGAKNPSSDRVKKIEEVIQRLGSQLRDIRLSSSAGKKSQHQFA